ncbi:MAG: tRNA epoxyqueuosine(34) reductase QueG [Acidobacteriota bacterium]
MRKAEIIQEVVGALRRAGFPLVGTCSGRLEEEPFAYDAWVAAGLHGPLGYMASTAHLRRAPEAFLPWVRGVFCAALPYNTRREFSAAWTGRGRSWVSCYAWGRDYHREVMARLRPAVRLLQRLGCLAHAGVDAMPVMERALAARAGLGFIGKNGLLIHPRYGSYLFLGEILTDLPLEDSPDRVADGCGGCALCMRGCPTRAFPRPRVLDASRCLSTWTIEYRGAFPPEAPPLSGHLFGCDRCQEVCPYNRRAPLAGEEAFRPREGCFAPAPGRIAAMTEAEWDTATRGSALRRAGYDGLVRNARRILEEWAGGGQ